MILARNILITMLMALYPVLCLGGEPFSCMYEPKASEANPEPELTSYDDCGVVNESGELLFTPEHLAQIAYGGKGNLACIYTRSAKATSIYYRNSDGVTMETINFDNGCDYFVSGLARTKIDGKYAYFDHSLKIKLVTPYTHATPFYDGLAIACRGGKYVQDGEHEFLEGAECAYFDLNGRIVVDFMPQDKLPRRDELTISGKP